MTARRPPREPRDDVDIWELLYQEYRLGFDPIVRKTRQAAREHEARRARERERDAERENE